MSFAIRRLRVEQAGSGIVNAQPITCQEPNCSTHARRPRQANRGCERLPKQCAPCCKGNSGCKSHRVLGSGGGGGTTNVTSAQVNSADLDDGIRPPPHVGPVLLPAEKVQAAPRQYARPLDPKYASGYVEAHLKTYEATQKYEANRRLNLTISSTVQVIFWAKV